MIKKQEFFIDIKGFENIYAVSTHGRVYSKKRNIFLSSDKSSGYERVTLKGKRYYVHILVAETFLDNPKQLPQVNHIDENKLNNRFDNLEFITHRNNISHSATKKSISGVNGVHWIESMSKYQCSVYYKGKKHYLGSTSDIKEAKKRVLQFKKKNNIL